MTSYSTMALSNTEPYNQGESSCRDDDNVLERLDNLELNSLIPTLFELMKTNRSFYDSHSHKPQIPNFSVLDLSYDTGRALLKVLKAACESGTGNVEGHRAGPGAFAVKMYVMYASKEMASAVQKKVTAYFEQTSKEMGGPWPDTDETTMFFNPDIFDMLNTEDETAADHLQCGEVDCVISTLVLEHLPVDTYFRNVAGALLPGGYALITNMHPDMGKIRQAESTNQMLEKKIQMKSYNHTIEDIVDAAKKYGMEVVNEIGIKETGVGNDKDAELKRLGLCAKKWAGRGNLWFGTIFKKI